ncbi:MAG TPA: protein phosphatase 2C domain-containing protein [Chthoniobacterales bacterium]|jgi:serine/threonine protein phosphatase PrpC|nr:protein phosphatase 2C domain-containing protein [Chthoniobacterales bacterium]
MIAEKDFAGRQSPGTRPSQEDAYAFSEVADGSGKIEGVLVAVADGMGGHSSGERASALAIKAFDQVFCLTSGVLSDRIAKSLAAAHDAVKNELQRDPALEGMGTTLTAVGITRAGVEWISVGDSPLYLLRGGELERLNEDHSLRPILQERAGAGKPIGQSGSILRAALTGEEEIAMVDQSPQPIPLQDGDLIIVATDGIHTLHGQEIVATCADSNGIDASVLADALLQAVTNADNPKQDNVTIAVIKPPVG